MTDFDTIYARMAETYAEAAGFSPDDASDAALRLKAAAGEIYAALCMLDNVRRDAFPETAVGAALDLHAAQRGLTRKAALKAGGTLTFSRAEALGYDVEIPAGTVCAASGAAVQFETTAPATLVAGQLSVTAPASSVAGGKACNAAAGAVDTLVMPPVGIERVENTEPFSGGADAETDDLLRLRLLRSYSVLPNGTNAETYRRAALEVEGVKSANVVPMENGAGTVSVYIYGDGAPVTEAVLGAVAEKLAALREISVKVTVGAAEAVSRGVSAFLTAADNCDFASAKALCEEAIRAVYARYTVGQPFRTAELVTAMMQTGAVKNCRLATSMADYATAADEIVVLGSVTLLDAEAGQ